MSAFWVEAPPVKGGRGTGVGCGGGMEFTRGFNFLCNVLFLMFGSCTQECLEKYHSVCTEVYQ